MIAAIIDAVAAGERDFLRLQQKAIDAWGVRPLVKAVERRKRLRLVTSTDDDASDGQALVCDEVLSRRTGARRNRVFF